MSLLKNCCLILNVLVIFWEPIECKPTWTYELISIDTQMDTPDSFNVSLYIQRISRGRFGVAGTLLIAEDLTNDTIISVNVFYSYNSHDYARSPLHIPKSPLMQFMQTHYKDMIYESLLDCSKNLPDLENKEAVTKRLIELESCEISNENMPSHVKSGYYKIVITVEEQVRAILTIVIRVEPKD